MDIFWLLSCLLKNTHNEDPSSLAQSKGTLHSNLLFTVAEEFLSSIAFIYLPLETNLKLTP